MLLVAGAAVDARDARRATPLTIAAQSGHAACVAYLLKHGVDLRCQDIEGDTALSWTAYNGMAEICSMLAAMGADTQHKDKYGMTPLHLAAQRGQSEAVEVLVDCEVEVSPLDTKVCITLFGLVHDRVLCIIMPHCYWGLTKPHHRLTHRDVKGAHAGRSRNGARPHAHRRLFAARGARRQRKRRGIGAAECAAVPLP